MEEKEQMIKVMDWGIKVVISPGVVTDDSNLIEKIEYLINACKKAGKNRLLVDASLSKRNVNISKMFSAGKFLEELGLLGIKIAIVGEHLVNNPDSNFMVTTAKNRGVDIEYFKNNEIAIDWLLEK